MVDESSTDIQYTPRHKDEDVKTIVEHSLRELGAGKPVDYDDMALHRRLALFDQRIEEQGAAILAKKPEAKLGLLNIPEDARGKKDLSRMLGGLTDGIDKIEAVLYKTEYMMRYKQEVPERIYHHYPVAGIEYYSNAENRSLEMFSSMGEMLREAMSPQNGKKDNKNGNKRIRVTTSVESPTGVDISHQPNNGREPARFKLKMSRPYRYVNDEGKQQESQELIEISCFPLEYAPYQMLDSPSSKQRTILERSQNATTNQLREMLANQLGHLGAEEVGHMVHNYSQDIKKLGADTPHISIKYARGPQQIILRGNITVQDGHMGIRLAYPGLKTEAFIPIYESPATRKVEDGLDHKDANRLYNIGMAIASVKN